MQLYYAASCPVQQQQSLKNIQNKNKTLLLKQPPIDNITTTSQINIQYILQYYSKEILKVKRPSTKSSSDQMGRELKQAPIDLVRVRSILVQACPQKQKQTSLEVKSYEKAFQGSSFIQLLWRQLECLSTAPLPDYSPCQFGFGWSLKNCELLCFLPGLLYSG